MTKRSRKPVWEILDAIYGGWEPTPEDLAELQEWVDNGQIWGLQGYYDRLAAALLQQGILKYPVKRTYDYYGNPIPTRAEYEAWLQKHRHRPVAQKLMTKPARVSAPLMHKPKATIITPIQKPKATIITPMHKPKATIIKPAQKLLIQKKTFIPQMPIAIPSIKKEPVATIKEPEKTTTVKGPQKKHVHLKEHDKERLKA